MEQSRAYLIKFIEVFAALSLKVTKIRETMLDTSYTPEDIERMLREFFKEKTSLEPRQ